MKVTSKFISIPPYISTSWSQVYALYMQENRLVIRLTDGTTIQVPDLQQGEIEAVFTAHAAFTEGLSEENKSLRESFPSNFQRAAPNPSTLNSFLGQNNEVASMHFNLDNMESFSSALLHNPAQANMPDLPAEIVAKIAAIAKIIAPGEIQNMPKPEAHCNCPHCQIARAIHGTENQEKKELKEEEIVDDLDLSFRQWEIVQTGDKLYSVTNCLDLLEKYSVYLGEPVGCTCGVSGCEHILAVLKS